MLIIDIPNQRVNSSPVEPSVVILKGASVDLITSLQKLTLTSGVSVLQPPTPSPEVLRSSRKVGLGGRSATPTSTMASAEGDYNDTFAQLSKIINAAIIGASLNQITKATADKKMEPKSVKSSAKVLKKETQTLKQYSNKLANTIISNEVFVEYLRKYVQNSSILNPNQSLPTTRNISAAIALYAHYGTDRSFISNVGASQISATTTVSGDTVARLATDFSILTKKGASTATRYFVTKAFEQALITALHQPKFEETLMAADALQDKIDALGTLRA